MVRMLVLLAVLVCADHARGEDGALVTVAEASGFERTARLDEVESFLARLAERSPLVHLGSLGRTVEGRGIPLAIVADPPVRTPGEVGDRLVVLLFGSIHAGEICGKEALLMLARELVESRARGEDALLDHLVLCLVPVFNADGNERVAPDNRPGQAGPREMGARENAQGLDLNRDWVKMDAPETRAMVAFQNAWDPSVIVDTHTTNGSRHRYTLTYQGPKHPAGDAGVIAYVRDTMLPAIDGAFEATTGYKAFFYGNFARGHRAWVTYPAEPRYGVAYRGMRNRLSIITEAYAYASFEDRVRSTLAFCREILRYTAVHHAELRALLREADDRTMAAGRAGDPLPVRIGVVPFEQRETILGYEEYDDAGARIEGGAEKAWVIPFENNFIAEESIDRAGAYVLPPALAEIAAHLLRHGVAVERLTEPAGVLAERSTILRLEHADRVYEGRRRVNAIEIRTDLDRLTLDAGSFIVRTDQALGTLAAYLLEPRSTDGLAGWGLLSPWLAEGAMYPVVRVPAGSIGQWRAASVIRPDAPEYDSPAHLPVGP